MDENRVVGSFRDELGLAIEATVDVSPAPELRAQIRARIDRERAAAGRWMPWQLAVGGVLAVAITMVVATATWQWNREQHPALVEIVSMQRHSLTAYVAAPSPVRSRADRSVVHATAVERPVRNEAAMLAAYVAHIRQLGVIPSSLTGAPARPSGEPLKLSNISIERIAIEPLAKLAAISGDRQ